VTDSTRADQRSSGPRRQDDARAAYALKHQRLGWWLLFVFASLGLVLESLQGFKIQMYLSVSNETRRLMWTLAHAHGALLAVINIVFGLSLSNGLRSMRGVQRISSALTAGSILLPVGFFAGGIAFYEGDPGLGIIIVPVGAAVLLYALFSIAQEVGRPGEKH
jgi:hypothetical protein